MLLEPGSSFFISPENGDVCCVRENQDLFLYPSSPCNGKGNLHIQDWFTIPLIGPGICELCSLFAILLLLCIYIGNETCRFC